ncbi:Glucose/arabinose dehydrogenase, beta-propeller fold [Sinosporangium album]|uniref:Glucose/arabinose dehydrogenase, beta-propeller fold n=1 Tax=Sinosporangium album TaxID=504805 RepID=A0A1G8AUZ5_9ACTN|nr:PQQ-dependent sugar dehydrogenase [Sinosporangium album]SDH24643.1 Glucose/arabinose dehydrogenase, beta-propeller fold [Sinosporangium album]
MIIRTPLAAALAVALAAVTACSTAPAERAGAATPQAGTTPPGPSGTPPGAPRTLVENLAVPWAIAFLPGGDALVTERDSARLLRITPEGRVTAIGKVEGVAPQGEGGLMGVAVSPKYDTDRTIFLYFTSDEDNRVVRYRLDSDRLSNEKVIVPGIPSGGIHDGGRIAFGPDGFLYIATGEVGDKPLAQDRNSLAGKILRVTPDGGPAPGNPFPGSRVWSYGHRNVQGLAWDPQGRLYASEFGQNTYDEINLIRKGGNYGWPEVEGVGSDKRYINPILTWPTSEASPSGMAYAAGSLWVAALRGQRLWQVPLTPDGTAGAPSARFRDEYGRLRAVTTTPDGGSLWVGTSNKDGRGSPRQGDDRVLVVPVR